MELSKQHCKRFLLTAMDPSPPDPTSPTTPQQGIPHSTSRMHVVQVSLIGEQSDFVCSGSDGGSIFIWNARTGQLVNVLRANETVTTCVAPHPHVPMLASCGFEPAVRLWSPEVCTRLHVKACSASFCQPASLMLC